MRVTSTVLRRWRSSASSIETRMPATTPSPWEHWASSVAQVSWRWMFTFLRSVAWRTGRKPSWPTSVRQVRLHLLWFCHLYLLVHLIAGCNFCSLQLFGLWSGSWGSVFWQISGRFLKKKTILWMKEPMLQEPPSSSPSSLSSPGYVPDLRHLTASTNKRFPLGCPTVLKSFGLLLILNVSVQGHISESRITVNPEYVKPELRETLSFPFHKASSA